MKKILLRKNLFLMIALDAVVVTASLYFSYLFRFEFAIPAWAVRTLVQALPLVLLVKLGCFFVFDVYRGMWRYTSVGDLVNVAKAVFTSSLLVILGVLMMYRFTGYPRSAFVMDAFLTFLGVGGIRVLIRLYYSRKSGVPGLPLTQELKSQYKRILIIGAGDAGEKTVRELMDNPRLPYQVVGFVDDDPGKVGLAIHGIPVLGRVEELDALVAAHRIDELLIAVPSATGSQMRRIVKACDTSSVPFKTLPGMGELIDGKVSVKALRDVNFQDLLGRQPVSLDLEGIQRYVSGKSVMVTGAGGSIGSELCRQIVRFHPDSLILLDASEENLYGIQMELLHQLNYSRITAILGGVQNHAVMEEAFGNSHPNLVFHAAAYKHVPMIENNPWQAVYNNIIGSQTVMEWSMEAGVENVVLVSTDKAVRPTSVMGASKRVCELLMQAFNKELTRMMGVRFGNVVGSSGSVIPLFRKQIELGGPVTVTHPEITRYFMTISEACQLILQAGAIGKGGEIFILEMGTPVRIVDMARDLIRLSGREPDREIEIVLTGLRPGEKLYEELITEGEGIVPTSHEKILVLHHDEEWNGFSDQNEFRGQLLDTIEELRRLADNRDSNGIKRILTQVVSDYYPNGSETAS